MHNFSTDFLFFFPVVLWGAVLLAELVHHLDEGQEHGDDDGTHNDSKEYNHYRLE